MADGSSQLPATAEINSPPSLAQMIGSMSPAMAIMLDDRSFERFKAIAKYMAAAEGMIPRHLISKPEACFAVVMRALTWHLDPYAVALSTYQTPGGSVGYEGKLCQAIIENSGKLEGGVKYTHFGTVKVKTKDGRERRYRTNDPALGEAIDSGATEISRKDWPALVGKYELKDGSRGGKYASPTWTKEDAEGLGVIVSAQVKGEAAPREWEFQLVQAFPLNSTLWATDPKSQICYTAVRRFASLAAPGLFMGVPFDHEDIDVALAARDVTPPRPTRDQFETATPAPAAVPGFEIVTLDGEIVTVVGAKEASDRMIELMDEATKRSGRQGLEGIWESNERLPVSLRNQGAADIADMLHGAFADRDAALAKTETVATAKSTTEAPPHQTPRKIAVPVNAAGDGTDWPKFGAQFIDAIKGAKSSIEISAWIDINGAALGNCATNGPNAYKSIQGAILAAKEKLAKGGDNVVSAGDQGSLLSGN